MSDQKPIQIYCMALQDRSDRVRWLLEELGVPYENIFLEHTNGSLNPPADYLKLNPMGRVPTIVDNGKVVHESVGIALYLADKYIEKGLAPRFDHSDRAAYYQWMVFSVGSLEAVVARMFARRGKSELEQKLITDYVQEQCEILQKALNQTLAKQDYILPSGFSAADIMLAAVIPGASEFLMKPGSPIEAYMKRMMARPAAVKVKVFE